MVFEGENEITPNDHPFKGSLDGIHDLYDLANKTKLHLNFPLSQEDLMRPLARLEVLLISSQAQKYHSLNQHVSMLAATFRETGSQKVIPIIIQFLQSFLGTEFQHSVEPKIDVLAMRAYLEKLASNKKYRHLLRSKVSQTARTSRDIALEFENSYHNLMNLLSQWHRVYWELINGEIRGSFASVISSFVSDQTSDFFQIWGMVNNLNSIEMSKLGEMLAKTKPRSTEEALFRSTLRFVAWANSNKYKHLVGVIYSLLTYGNGYAIQPAFTSRNAVNPQGRHDETTFGTLTLSDYQALVGVVGLNTKALDRAMDKYAKTPGLSPASIDIDSAIFILEQAASSLPQVPGWYLKGPLSPLDMEGFHEELVACDSLLAQIIEFLKGKIFSLDQSNAMLAYAIGHGITRLRWLLLNQCASDLDGINVCREDLLWYLSKRLLSRVPRGLSTEE